MSYCRITDGTSDVYVYGGGKGIECIIAHHISVENDLPASTLIEYADRLGETERAMLGYLRFLQYRGLKVPEYAIVRLCEEIGDALDDCQP